MRSIRQTICTHHALTDRGGNIFPHVSAIMQTYRMNDAINKDRLCLGACRRPALSGVTAFVLQCSTQHTGERQVEEGAFWHLGRRLSGMQGHELAGTCLAHPRRRRRYNIAIMPMRLVERHESVEASTVPFSRRN